MARKLPPLHLLSIFEAAARLESFKAASEVLYLSPSAVSHQIKALEAYFGFPLFIRKNRRVTLNSAGKLLFGYTQQSMKILDQGTQATIRKFSAPSLKISTFPTMAANVIIPQLGLFQTAHPDIDIRIETGLNLTDFNHDDIDLALRLGQGQWPDVGKTKLLDIRIAALCSPSFAEKHQLNHISKINDVPLIDLSNMDHIWKTWSQELGLAKINSEHKLTFNSYESAIQAACQGLGLVLAMLPIERSLIEKELLIQPFAETINFHHALYAVYRHEDKNRHEIQCFLDWLLLSPNLADLA
ncbi:MAG: LysR substrate-binding domain-containing protein [Thalassotalea sp.]